MSLHRLILVFVLSCFPLHTLEAQDRDSFAGLAKVPKDFKVPPDLIHHPDLTYRVAEETELKLDMVAPRQGKGPFPAVVVLHGGGWVIGSRKGYLPYLLKPAQAGYVMATVEYRLAPKYRFPAQVEDIKAAVRWLRANAEKYRIDRDHIALLGFSAGGHLACLTGMTAGNKQRENRGGLAQGANAPRSPTVQAVVGYYPLTDLKSLYESCVNKEVLPREAYLVVYSLQSFLGGLPGDVAERYRLASPITYISKDCPPMLLIHGTADQYVPLRQSRTFAAKLTEAGGVVSLVEVEKAPHNFRGEPAEQVMENVLEFLDKHLKPKRQ